MSEIKSVLVHLDANPEAAQRLRIACELARRFGAELSALYAVTPGAMTMAWDVTGNASALLAEIDGQRIAQARKSFDEAAAGAAQPMAWSRSAETTPVPSTVREALVHDLVVLGQRNPDLPWNGELPPDFVEAVIVGSGQPVLVLPYIGQHEGFGRNVMIAWKPTRESARAIFGALPLLRAAQQVHLVAWGEDAAASADGMRQRLARHGVSCSVRASKAVPEAVGEALLSQAADLDADLLVMGCYGHSRAREWVAGGATRTLLRSMTIPVLMAH